MRSVHNQIFKGFSPRRWLLASVAASAMIVPAAVTVPVSAEVSSSDVQSGPAPSASATSATPQSDGERPGGIECGDESTSFANGETVDVNFCYRLARTALRGEAITIEGTGGWWAQPAQGDGETREVKIRLYITDGRSRSYISRANDPENGPYAVVPISPQGDGTWSAKLPFPTNENAQLNDGGDVDSKLRPGSYLGVTLNSLQPLVDPSDSSPRTIELAARSWTTITRPARAGEYAPRIIEQPESFRNGSDPDSENKTGGPAVEVAPKIKSNPQARSVWQGYEPPDRYLPDDLEGWIPMSRNDVGVSTEFYPEQQLVRDPNRGPYFTDWYFARPTRRAIIINEVGNTVTEPVNGAIRPKNDPVKKDATKLTDSPEYQGQFTTAQRVRRGQSLTIGWGRDRPNQRMAAVIFQGPGYKSFGWKRTNSLGRVTVTIPRNCSLGKHKLAVYDGAGYLVGWNRVEVVK